jgi:predicted permease
VLAQLRYALRVSLKRPGLSLVAVATLAVGIAANTTVFSWIDDILLRPLPGVAAPAELVAFETLTPNGEFLTTSYADFRDYRDNVKSLAGLAVAQPRALSLGQEDHAERLWGELVSGNYFAVLGVKPVLGRVFSPDEYGDAQGGYPVAVISDGLWRRRFNRDPHVIGRTIRINRQQLTVVGVAPPEFRGTIPGLAFEIWVPAMMGTALNLMPDWMMADRGTRSFVAVARLKPGVTMEQARAEISAVGNELARRYKRNQGMSATVLPLWKGHFGAQAMLVDGLRILMAVGGVVLLIVCANVANLLLAGAVTRQKEFALRLALGSGRGQLVRQLLAESLVLAMLGTIAGIPIYMWMAQGLGGLLPPGVLPIALDVHMSTTVFAYTALLCILACVISGIAPALHTSRTDLNEVLKHGGGRSGSAGVRSRGMRRLLVVAEVALALVAIISAGLFARSFQMARRIDPGFDAHNVLVSHLYLSTAGYPVSERKLFCRRLRERLESQPGVVAVTYADMVPLGFDAGPWEDLQVEGYVPSPSENMKIYRNMVAPGYFNLMHIPLVEGRDFTEQDDEKSQRVMIVTEAFVRHFYGGRNPIGRRVRGWGDWFTIVGVAKDSKYRTPNEPPKPYFYVAFRQMYRADLAIAVYVRTKGDPARALPMVRREVRGIDPNIGMFDAMPLAEFIGASLFSQKVAALLLSVLGAIALILAGVGLYGVMGYSMGQRTQEIGIRMALGARPASVIALALRDGMGMAAVGLVLGLAGAVAVSRLASGLLVKVSATDPLVFGGAALFLAMVALLASYIPARRATKVDPNVALRCE